MDSHQNGLSPNGLSPNGLSQMESHQVDNTQQDPQRLMLSDKIQSSRLRSLTLMKFHHSIRWTELYQDACGSPTIVETINTNSRSISKDRYKSPLAERRRGLANHSAYGPAPAKDSPGFMKSFTNWVSGPKRPSAKEGAKQQMHKKRNNTDHRLEDAHRGDGASELIPISQDDIIQLKHTLNGKERQWEAREREFRQPLVQISHHLEENTRILKTKLHESESEKFFLARAT